MQQHHPNCANVLFLLRAPPLRYSGPDVPYLFRQDSNFLYLSGLKEPESVLAIYSDTPDSSCHRSALFVKPRDAHSELWHGPCAGTDGASSLTGVDFVAESSELAHFLESFRTGARSLYCDISTFSDIASFDFERLISGQLAANNLRLVDRNPVDFVHSLRWVKSAAEAKLAGSAHAANVKRSISLGIMSGLLEISHSLG